MQWEYESCRLLQVKFPDGSEQEALAPVACLLNHSPVPHVVCKVPRGPRILKLMMLHLRLTLHLAHS